MMVAEDTDPDACPHCGAVVTAPARHANDGRLERSGCTSCGLQVVRRPGEAWRGIRG